MNPSNRIIIMPSEAHEEFDDVAVLQPEGAAEEMLRDHFEDVRVVGADRHDHGAVHKADRRQETLRAPNVRPLASNPEISIPGLSWRTWSFARSGPAIFRFNVPSYGSNQSFFRNWSRYPFCRM